MAPSVRDMVSSHTLATEIINRHDTDDSILDDGEMNLLRQWCLNPENAKNILEERGMLDATGTQPGTLANESRGSLAGYCIATHGTERSVLTEDEFMLLQSYFKQQGNL
ncbi:hypothetical protein MBLNU457_3644t1 [Dothideomycetes sp. NU457]